MPQYSLYFNNAATDFGDAKEIYLGSEKVWPSYSVTVNCVYHVTSTTQPTPLFGTYAVDQVSKIIFPTFTLEGTIPYEYTFNTVGDIPATLVLNSGINLYRLFYNSNIKCFCDRVGLFNGRYSVTNMFEWCPLLECIDLTTTDTTDIVDYNLMINDSPRITTIVLGGNYFNKDMTYDFTTATKWTAVSMYESLYTNQDNTTWRLNGETRTITLAPEAFARLSASQISDIQSRGFIITNVQN